MERQRLIHVAALDSKRADKNGGIRILDMDLDFSFGEICVLQKGVA